MLPSREKQKESARPEGYNFHLHRAPGEARHRMSTEWTVVTEIGAFGMSFQQLLTESIQIPTDTEQKNTEKIPTKDFEYVSKILNRHLAS